MRTIGVLGAALVAVSVLAGPAQAGTVTVDTRDELIAALAGAVAGDTVFVAGGASIDLTGRKRIPIPAGVTLASDRGSNGSPGALLYNTELDLGDNEAWAQFTVTGSGTRVTGLRLRGPDSEIRDSAYQYDTSRGIEASSASDLTVDNNELSAWAHAAVYLRDTIEARYSRNNVHHNRRTGLGYGIVLVNDSSAVIEYNTFSQNRHAIAANGIRTIRYEARYNLVIDNGRGHGFDVHGEDEALGNGAPYAGDVIHIKHNTFRSKVEAAVKVRGKPATGAYVSGNCFAHSSASAAVQQVLFTGNFNVGPNTYNTTTTSCHNSPNPVAWKLSDAGTATWTALAPYTFDTSEVGFGDFDGDGKTDVLRATGGRWYYSPGGTGRWVPGALAGTTRTNMRFGDFDGDGRTDVFTVEDRQWKFSSGATASWQPLATSGESLAELRFGDFDGDGRTDVFTVDGDGKWLYSSGGRSSWAPLASASLPVQSLGFGDFDGDRKTDVFALVGDRWQFSSGGSAGWQPLAVSSEAASALRFGDFDGDGRTDVFRSDNTAWYVSSGGRTSWVRLNTSSCPANSLAVADFTGDGKADVFTGRCGG
ncbi:MAG: FG-GAP-like repeat-containing protein [Kibdelosporangium sp.]